MATLTVSNFGGEFPSLSPNTLPTGAAQVNANLFLGVNEFRPLSQDTTVAAATPGSRTLYRFSRNAAGDINTDPASGWVASAEIRNYAKGQVNADTSEKTYFTTDDGSQPLRVVTPANPTMNRLVGVPAPSKPTVSGVISDEITQEEASDFLYGDGIKSIHTALKASILDASNTSLDASRRNSSNLPTAGPYSTYGLLYVDEPSTSVYYAGQPFYLVAQFPWADAEKMNLLLGEMEGNSSGPEGPSRLALLPVVALPFVYRLDEVAAKSRLEAITCPLGFGSKVGQRLLTDEQITDIIDETKKWFDPENYAQSLRSSLDQKVQAFARLIMAKPDGAHATVADAREKIADATHAINLSTVDRFKRFMDDDLFVKSWVDAEGGIKGIVGDTVDRVVDTRFYVTTFVTDWEEESAPSPVSDQVDVDQNDSVTVDLPAVPEGRNITKWRVYRSNTGSARSEFQYVGEAAVSETTFTDSVKSEALGEVCPTVTWAAPPELSSGPNRYLRGLVGMPNGVFAGYLGDTVAFCEPYKPYAWPVEYQITLEFPVVALGVFGQTLFVGTTSNPYYISGADSASMSAQKMDSKQSCVSARSVVSVSGGVVYASPDGLCLASASGIKNMTAGVYTREDWQKLNPSSMFCVVHEDICYVFYAGGTGGCLAFNPATGKLGRVDLSATAAFSDTVTDTLYFVSGSNIRAAFSATTARQADWRSGVMTLPAQQSLAWLKVYGEQTPSNPLTVRWYGDGELRHTVDLTSSEPVRLPFGRWLNHEVRLTGAARATRVVLAGHTAELQAV